MTRERRFGELLLLVVACAGLAAFAGCDGTDLKDGPSVMDIQPKVPEPDLGPCESPPTTTELDVLINEVMLINQSELADANGNFVPWIELFNPSATSFNLGGTELSLADSLVAPREDQQVWQFPCEDIAVLEPGQFLIVFLDGGTSTSSELHASIVPDPTLLSVFILNGGSDVAQVPASSVFPDESVGRPNTDPSVFVRLESPSPGSDNGGPFIPVVVTFVRGDADENGLVQAADLTLLAAIVFDPLQWGPCVDRLDVDDDGQVTVLDVSFLSVQLSLVMPQFPAPFPNPGTDPSDDDLDCVAP
ncbi:MAG: hypothetical protein AB7I09_02395 [Planctomycetota bacterium]